MCCATVLLLLSFWLPIVYSHRVIHLDDLWTANRVCVKIVWHEDAMAMWNGKVSLILVVVRFYFFCFFNFVLTFLTIVLMVTGVWPILMESSFNCCCCFSVVELSPLTELVFLISWGSSRVVFRDADDMVVAKHAEEVTTRLPALNLGRSKLHWISAVDFFLLLFVCWTFDTETIVTDLRVLKFDVGSECVDRDNLNEVAEKKNYSMTLGYHENYIECLASKTQSAGTKVF